MSKAVVKNEKGARLKAALAEKNIKASELARLTGKSRQQVNNWLSYGRYSFQTLDFILDKIGMAHSTFYRLKV